MPGRRRCHTHGGQPELRPRDTEKGTSGASRQAPLVTKEESENLRNEGVFPRLFSEKSPLHNYGLLLLPSHLAALSRGAERA